MSTSLYRQEAIDHQVGHISGEVFHPPARHWLAITLVLITLVICAGSYIGSTDYAQKFPARGTINESNAREILASEFSEVVALHVNEGDLVNTGDVLVTLSARHQRESREINFKESARQIDHWREIENIQTTKFKQSSGKLQAEIIANRASTTLAEEDVSLQLAKVQTLDEQLGQIETLFRKKHLSNLEWTRFKATVITERQTLNQYRQRLLGLKQARQQLEADLDHHVEEHKHAIKNIQLKLSSLRGHQASFSNKTKITAPIDGKVTGVMVSVGDTVAPAAPLFHLSTGHRELLATLHIPAPMVANVQPGQVLELELDAFPASHHGRVTGKVLRLSDHTFDSRGQHGYLATIELYGTEAISSTALLPGMGFRTYLVRDQQSVFTWLTGPLHDWFSR